MGIGHSNPYYTALPYCVIACRLICSLGDRTYTQMYAGVDKKQLLKSCSPQYQHVPQYEDTSRTPIMDVCKPICNSDNGCVVLTIGGCLLEEDASTYIIAALFCTCISLSNLVSLTFD